MTADVIGSASMNDERDDRVQQGPADDWRTVGRDDLDRYAPRRRGRLYDEDDHDDPRRKVKGPGLAMVIVGGMWLLLSLAIAGFGVALPFLWPAGQAGGPGDVVMSVAWVGIGILSAAGNAVAILAGVRMRQSRSWGLALTGAILLMLLNGLVGVLVGVWALVVLVNPDVKREFERAARWGPREREEW
jgi:hypothetical protein